MEYKFALLNYSTENIGDEVQSIAARRFLPHIDEYVDRDRLAEWEPNQPTKLIMNGWYNRDPKGWPPKNSDLLKPLLTSIHVSVKDDAVREAFETSESLEFLKKNGPVGARDIQTLEFFKQQGLETYFSGCVTLTLQRDPDIKKQDFILAVDVPKDVVKKMRESTKREVIELSVYHYPFLENEERFKVAEYILALYQSAHAVVTTRLHCFMPSLAFETPVLLIKDSEKYEPARYGGLDTLPHSMTDKEYIEHPEKYPLDSPLPNPTEYQTIREKMIERLHGFTGYSNDITFRTLPLSELPLNISAIRIFAYTWSSTYKKALLEGDVAWNEERIADFERILVEKCDELSTLDAAKQELNMRLNDVIANKTVEIDHLTDVIKHIENSLSWKLTKPLREMKCVLRKIIKR
ncbi:TPA: polysaccharide pyruvyl transferase family protein [Streptococcus suis]|nr:polysaccharide pyruvyl transferase family protein [Streptococcus suis]HEM5151266.1 polysaccharide pyruvyl transferase family protein [Streptococcus suis]HEM5168515.1 polysaccharide pyruvyl transferase family protein [Streptococcus suis]